jgi:hypothetical protein
VAFILLEGFANFESLWCHCCINQGCVTS